MSNAAQLLDDTYDQQVAAKGPGKTAAKGEIVDDDWNRRHFSYAAAVCEASGLDFVKLATIQAGGGTKGVDRIVAAMPADGPGAEAHRLADLIQIASTVRPGDVTKTVEKYRDGALSAEAQQAAFLDLYVEGWILRTSPRKPRKVTAAGYPQAHQVHELTGLDFEKLALVQLKGGKRGLRALVQTLPDLPQREACEAAL